MGVVDEGGVTTYKVIISDTINGGIMSPEDVKKVHSLNADETGAVITATESNDGLMGFTDKQNLDELMDRVAALEQGGTA
jgi:2-C-methyl-D-erythritol 4-phosphate cytidylyltransferase